MTKRAKNYIAYGKVCREYRKKKHINETFVAEILGVSQSAISQIEKGEIKPSLKHIKAYIQACEIEPAEIADFFSAALSESDTFEIKLDDTKMPKQDFLEKLAELLLNDGNPFPQPEDKRWKQLEKNLKEKGKHSVTTDDLRKFFSEQKPDSGT
jgi:transcriptional regulator with XRE-family HTH domain